MCVGRTLGHGGVFALDGSSDDELTGRPAAPSRRVDVVPFAYIVGAMAHSRVDRRAAILVAVIATPFLVAGVWRLHTRSGESAARTEAHSLLPAEARIVSEQAQSCGSDAGAARRCVRIVFRLSGTIADQTATSPKIAYTDIPDSVPARLPWPRPH